MTGRVGEIDGLERARNQKGGDGEEEGVDSTQIVREINTNQQPTSNQSINYFCFFCHVSIWEVLRSQKAKVASLLVRFFC